MRPTPRSLAAILLLSALPGAARAAAPASYRPAPRASYLDVGKFLVGTTFSYSKTGYADDYDRTSLVASLLAQYFMRELRGRDYLAVGGRFQYSRFSDDTTATVRSLMGPVATYYLGLQERLYLTGSQSILLQAEVRDNFYFATSTILGVAYFLTPSVSFGPGLEYSHAFGTTDVIGYDAIDFSLGFAIYL